MVPPSSVTNGPANLFLSVLLSENFLFHRHRLSHQLLAAVSGVYPKYLCI
jgi:hypothetical protein